MKIGKFLLVVFVCLVFCFNHRKLPKSNPKTDSLLKYLIENSLAMSPKEQLQKRNNGWIGNKASKKAIQSTNGSSGLRQLENINEGLSRMTISETKVSSEQNNKVTQRTMTHNIERTADTASDDKQQVMTITTTIGSANVRPMVPSKSNNGEMQPGFVPTIENVPATPVLLKSDEMEQSTVDSTPMDVDETAPKSAVKKRRILFDVRITPFGRDFVPEAEVQSGDPSFPSKMTRIDEPRKTVRPKNEVNRFVLASKLQCGASNPKHKIKPTKVEKDDFISFDFSDYEDDKPFADPAIFVPTADGNAFNIPNLYEIWQNKNTCERLTEH